MAKPALPSTEHALFFVEDIFDRCMTPFFLLGETAREIVDSKNRSPLDPLDTHELVEVGMKRNHYTEHFVRTAKMFLPVGAVWSKNKIEFEHLGTPVVIRIINKNFKVFDNPDTVHYKITTFKIPNPFSTYWKQRNLVR